ncbi:RNA-directed DNA polymerase, eukaryota [Tanacetum coccineum]
MTSISHMDVKFLWGNSNYDYVCSESLGNSGGILCIWEASIFKKINTTVSDNFIAIYGTWLPTNSKILFIAIYAPQQTSCKRKLWDYISNIVGRWNGESIIMGDFNEVRSSEERPLDPVLAKIRSVIADLSLIPNPLLLLEDKFSDPFILDEISHWLGMALLLCLDLASSSGEGVLKVMESIRSGFLMVLRRPVGKKVTGSLGNKVLASKKHGGLGVSSFFALNRALFSNGFGVLYPKMARYGDRWVCDLVSDGNFRVKEIRNYIDDLFLPHQAAQTRWIKYIPIKVNIFAWRARQDCLPTRVNLIRRGITIESSLCPVCSVCEEDVCHIFFRCDLAQLVLRAYADGGA